MTERVRSRRLQIAAVVGVLGVLVAGVTAIAIDVSTHDGRSAPRSAGDPSLPDSTDPTVVRLGAVGRILALRSAAVRDHDEAAFLRTVVDTDQEFVDRQRTLFRALAAVPFHSFDYGLSDGPEDRAGDGWRSDVVLRYQIAGYDPSPVSLRQQDTFVERGGEWLLADDGLGNVVAQPLSVTADVQPAIWDLGAVSVVRGVRSLVIGTDAPDRLQEIAAEADRDIPDVTAVWGSGWPQQAIVIVPANTEQFVALTGAKGDLSKLEAIQSAEVRDGRGDPDSTGNRITINPSPYRALSPVGRRVVLTHELTHVATRASTGRQTPLWLVEGFADYVGFLNSGIPLSDATTELHTALLSSGVPQHLPADSDFAVTNAQPAVAYEQSWLACRLLARLGGQAGLVAFYRAVGSTSDPSGGGEVDENNAVATGLARVKIQSLVSPEALVLQWQTSLRALVG